MKMYRMVGYVTVRGNLVAFFGASNHARVQLIWCLVTGHAGDSARSFREYFQDYESEIGPRCALIEYLWVTGVYTYNPSKH